jgi:hypothetical protein
MESPNNTKCGRNFAIFAHTQQQQQPQQPASKSVGRGGSASENARTFHTLLTTIRKEATNNKQMQLQQQEALLTAGCRSWKKG